MDLRMPFFGVAIYPMLAAWFRDVNLYPLVIMRAVMAMILHAPSRYLSIALAK